MMAMEPIETTCPRCGEYIDEGDEKYCPCGAELDFENISGHENLICPECNRYVKPHEVEWKCHKCGYDGKPQNCCGCNAPLMPKEDCLCEKCITKEAQQQYENGEHEVWRKRRGWWSADE